MFVISEMAQSFYSRSLSSEPCSPGPGFVESLPGSPYSGSVDDNIYLSGNFILPQFFFPCSGMVTSMNMSINTNTTIYTYYLIISTIIFVYYII